MGVAKLSRVTVISPRADYQEVLKRLSQFRDFHLIEDKTLEFDPKTQELAVRAVRLLAQSDQLVKDLAIPLEPSQMDIIFRGASINRTDYDATSWADLLGRAEAEFEPIRDEIREELNNHAQLSKQELETQTALGTLKAYSGISTDLTRLVRLTRLHAVLTICPTAALPELQRSVLDGAFLVTQKISDTENVVLLASPASDFSAIDKVLKTLDLKPFTMPEGLGTPSQAYQRLNEDLSRFTRERQGSEARLADLKAKHSDRILAVRDIAESSHSVLDETRMAGALRKLARISGYIPRNAEPRFAQDFNDWLYYTEPVHPGEHGVPVLMTNRGLGNSFSLITREQGTPGSHEFDPTPLVSLVFPIFFGMMFGDLGHGLVMTAFFALVRFRAKTNASLRYWSSIFVICGVSSMIFGVIFGEFFGFSLRSLIPSLPPVIDIVSRPPEVPTASLNTTATFILIEVAILIGVAHITTGLALDIAQAIRGHETVELLTEKVPTLVMYIGGILFGLAFIAAGYSFDVIKGSNPVPLLGLPTAEVGSVSLVMVFASMIVLVMGKAVAIMAGKLQGETVGGAVGNGGIEVFELISRFLANTISYVRLAILLFVHASLLLAINLLLGFPVYIAAVPMIILNILVIMFEVLIVYIQDLRLHIYEFFTKFYTGTGAPFVKLVPEKVRVRINWKGRPNP